jgi:DNA polymerase (family 10)
MKRMERFLSVSSVERQYAKETAHVHNTEIARKFETMADLLEIDGANPFRVRAYRKAARTVGEYGRSMEELIAAGEDLTELPGIGEELAEKIRVMVETGELPQLQELQERIPQGVVEMTKIAGLGPKRVQQLHEKLGIDTLQELEDAVVMGKVRELRGFGEKMEEKILEELERKSTEERRTRLDRAEGLVETLVGYLRSVEGVERVEVAGSYRRKKETVGDLDVLVISDEGDRVTEAFTKYPGVERVVSRGPTRATVMVWKELQVDLRVVPAESYGAALFYFTGSQAHNIAVRSLALDRGLKLNEYGVFRDEERVAGETEGEIYELLGMSYVPPELREERGEVEAARAGRLPALVTLGDIRGDLQAHTVASDGKHTLEEMARAAQELGYEYLAVTDHSPRLAMIQGLDAEGLLRRIDEVERLNESLEGFRVLKSIEVDILDDGSLDMPDQVLERLDVVVAAVHTRFTLSEEEQTERILRAMENPNAHILAHPTGRQLGKRPGYEVDVERLIEAAAEGGWFLEINAEPDRLDIDDVYALMAKEHGVKVAISTDAHSVNGLRVMRYGVYQARRGWLEARDVLNTYPWRELREFLRR